MKTLEEVAAMLDLPTAEDVADLLRAHGVRGDFGSGDWCGTCPIAVFAQTLTGLPVRSGGLSLKTQLQDVSLPDAARDFIRLVDGDVSRFADLVAL